MVYTNLLNFHAEPQRRRKLCDSAALREKLIKTEKAFPPTFPLDSNNTIKNFLSQSILFIPLKQKKRSSLLKTFSQFKRIYILLKRVNVFGQFGFQIACLILMNDIFLNQFIDH